MTLDSCGCGRDDFLSMKYFVVELDLVGDIEVVHDEVAKSKQ